MRLLGFDKLSFTFSASELKSVQKLSRAPASQAKVCSPLSLLYIPFWCVNNTFADQYRWIHSYNPSHPELVFAEPHPDDAPAFYEMLFDYGAQNGMGGFEHDYLDYNYVRYARRM